MPSQQQLIRELTRRTLTLWQNDTTDMAADIMRQPVAAYLDADRYAHEVDRIFRQLPLALAVSSELPGPNTYKAMDVMGVPVLLTRAADGEVRAFLNTCKHRGAPLCESGSGEARRLTCPYHAWVYDPEGALVGMFGADTFGEIDRDEFALTGLPCAERVGLVFVSLTPGRDFDIDTFLGDIAEPLGQLDLGDWHVFEQRELDGPGWKVAWDGYLEGYHQAALHPNTVGQNTIANLMAHDTYGPHQRIVFGRKTLADIGDVPEDEWDDTARIRIIHSLFPNLSISGVLDDFCLVSQLFPGPTVDRSRTVQTLLCRRPPTTTEHEAANAAFSKMALVAVRDEDYWIGHQIQRSLTSGATDSVVFGRNEPALQHYHRAVERYAEQ